MKKTVMILLLCLIGTGVTMATKTVQLAMKLTAANSAAYSRVLITEDSERLNEYENGYDAQLLNLNPTNSTNVFLFAVERNGEYCSSVYYNNIDNLPLGFKTNLNETSYTITFTALNNTSGRELFLYDAQENVFVPITTAVGSNSYSFTAPAGQEVILDRFVINPSFTVTTNTSGYATYSNNLDLVLTAGQAGDPKVCSAAYTSVSDEEGLLTLHAEAGVPANTGVIIRGAASTTYTLVPATIAPFTSTNVLEASVEETTNPGALCMATIGGVCAFYEYTGAMISANKAYLPLSVLTEGGVAAPKRVRMVVEGATALDDNASTDTKVEKIMVNGQVYILRDGQRYDVMGQIVK